MHATCYVHSTCRKVSSANCTMNHSAISLLEDFARGEMLIKNDIIYKFKDFQISCVTSLHIFLHFCMRI